MKKITTPAPYFGGKFGTIGSQIAHYINQTEHRIYVEPFGGMAGVLFLKRPSPVEVYNDIDKRLVNLFRVLRSKSKTSKLYEQLELTPFAREEYLAAQQVVKESLVTEVDEIELARATVVCLSMSIQPSMQHNGFKCSTHKYDSNVATQFRKRTKQFNLITERIKDVMIENCDASKLMLRFDSPQTLIYLDPPYVKSTRNHNRSSNRSTHKDYGYEMDDIDHKMMLVVSGSLKSKVIISGYISDIYEEQLKGWYKKEIRSTSFISGSQMEKGDTSMARTEVLWSNFEIPDQLSLL